MVKSDHLKKAYDVVVIGGGAIGTSVVYHLSKMLGVSNIALLEKDKLTAGTTWHSAGLLWQLRPSDIEVELIQHTRNLAKHEGNGNTSALWCLLVFCFLDYDENL